MKMRKKFLLFLVCILLVLTLTGIIIGLTKERDYIIQSFQKAFDKEINPVLQAKWRVQYLSYEAGISTDIFPLDETILEINITNTNGGGYKFYSAVCNISNADTIEKFEYNPATEVWASTGNLNHALLINYGLPADWCSETNGNGFVLFSSTSQNKRMRLKFPEGNKRIILITGSNSEKVDISYSGTITQINGVAFVEFKSDEVGRMNNNTITMVTNIGNLR